MFKNVLIELPNLLAVKPYPFAYIRADRRRQGQAAFRFGVAHGSIRDFSKERPHSSVINSTRVEKARFDYLALGAAAAAPRRARPRPDRKDVHRAAPRGRLPADAGVIVPPARVSYPGRNGAADQAPRSPVTVPLLIEGSSPA